MRSTRTCSLREQTHANNNHSTHKHDPTHLIQCRCSEEGMAAHCGTSTSGPSSAASWEADASAAPASALQQQRQQKQSSKHTVKAATLGVQGFNIGS